MAHYILPLSISRELLECEVRIHASGQYSIIIDGYRFLLPEAHSFDNVVEHLSMFQEAFERGISLVGNVPHDDDKFVCFDPNNDIPL